MADSEVKKHCKEVQGLAKALVSRASFIQGAEKIDEASVLQEAKPDLEKEFGCRVEIEKAEKAKHAKARNALPYVSHLIKAGKKAGWPSIC